MSRVPPSLATPGPSDPIGAARDAETARLLAARDAEGLRRLLRDHGGRVREVLLREFEGVLDTSEIDDALSQASQRIWRSAGRFDLARGTLRAWLLVIARNCALRVLEVKRAGGGLQFVDDLDEMAAPERGGPTDAGRARVDQFRRDLQRCILQLTPQQQAVVLADLRAGGEAPARDLAAELATSVRVIYVARATARRALREALAALGYRLGAPPGSDREEAEE